MASISKSTNRTKKRLFRKINSKEKAIALIFLAALLLGLSLPSRIIVATSPSLSHRLFFLIGRTARIQTGDYLVFNHSGPKFFQQGLNQENDRFIKQVGCSPGETLTRDPYNRFFCNHRLLGKALERDSKERKLPYFSFNGPVPVQRFFMVGTNPRSFDSKYFGFIHEDEILFKALPLW